MEEIKLIEQALNKASKEGVFNLAESSQVYSCLVKVIQTLHSAEKSKTLEKEYPDKKEVKSKK